MIRQIEFTLQVKRRGCHLITNEVTKHLGELPEHGMLNLFVKHTSCALTINENADITVIISGRYAGSYEIHSLRSLADHSHNRKTA